MIGVNAVIPSGVIISEWHNCSPSKNLGLTPRAAFAHCKVNQKQRQQK
jgi:hypothetical protein